MHPPSTPSRARSVLSGRGKGARWAFAELVEHILPWADLRTPSAAVSPTGEHGLDEGMDTLLQLCLSSLNKGPSPTKAGGVEWSQTFA